MTTRLMSYNVRGLKDDRAALLRVIRHAAPDVLCLQEMPRHPFSDHRIAEFAESVGLVWGGGNRHRMSTAIVTAPRLDVAASGHGLYTVPRPQEPRGYAWAEVCLPGEAKWLAISTHLSLYSSMRAGHARELIADPNLPGDVPWAIAGDFNELENGPAGREFKAHGFVDAGPRINTFNAAEPHKRIDFVYASPSLTLETVDMSAVEHDMTVATDHRPLVVDVTGTSH